MSRLKANGSIAVHLIADEEPTLYLFVDFQQMQEYLNQHISEHGILQSWLVQSNDGPTNIAANAYMFRLRDISIETVDKAEGGW